MDLVDVDPAVLMKWNLAVPRYTSYPTAPQFGPISKSAYQERLAALKTPLSVYVHIPFCKTMCLFCGCSVVLNRKPENQTAYLADLHREIELLPFARQTLTQLHFGGGTPTSLSEEEFEALLEKLKSRFVWDEGAEISIEIDPRTVFADRGRKLAALKRLGFNRVSFGVQDLDPKVQEAVKRRQSEEMTRITVERAREFGFNGINLDLIYGLPYQTAQSFERTAEKIVELDVDRIAFYSYAKVPWLKPHQKAIPEEALPSTEEKFQIYVEARRRFMKGGYTAIGMDHFAKRGDPLAKAYVARKLTRNFQGYSLALADDLLGLGMSSIGLIENGYFQNAKTIESYHSALLQHTLPVERGFLLKAGDQLRRFIIQSLMCHFSLNPKEVESRFSIDFGAYFAPELTQLKVLKEEGLIERLSPDIVPTPLGRLFIRLIAAVFDVYLEKGRYSRAI